MDSEIDDYYHDHDHDLDDDTDDGASDAAIAINAFALRAAARVDRAWFAAAVPLHWRCPPESALHPDVVATAAYRCFYASHSRELYLTEPSTLWHALSGERAHGSDDQGAAGDAHESSPAGEDYAALQLPRLKLLYM
jgi:hypothetical protein